MVRISDARMSGTAYGTVVLHVVPEAAAGGPLALIRSGDMIEVDVPGRSIHVELSDEELETRKKEWEPAELESNRGYVRLYIEHVNQADKGCDLDFLIGQSGAAVPRERH